MTEQSTERDTAGGKLTEAQKDRIQTAYRAWLEGRGFSPRRGQREMIANVARAVAGDEPRIGVVEAGTGTGKTAAYCLAIVPIAQSLNKRVVIATATIALQEQVVLRDLPDIQQHAGLDFDFTLAKGRGRYVCLKRLDDHLVGRQADLLPGFEPASNEDEALFEELLRAFAANEWNGELESWPDGIDHAAWSRVTTDHRGCTNNRCSYFRQCPFFKARASIDEADVIVANHDLVLADLALGGGIVLPDPADTIYVLDEAHHLPDKTQQHFTNRCRLRTTSQWLDQVATTLGTMVTRFGRPPEAIQAAGQVAKDTEVITGLLSELEHLVEQLEFSPRDDEHEIARLPSGAVPDEVVELSVPLARYFASVGTVLEDLSEKVTAVVDGELSWSNAEQAEDWLPVLGQLASRASSNEALFTDYARWESKSRAARWVVRMSFEIGSDVELVSAPLNPGEILGDVLWDACHAALATSATLCALGRFDRFLDRAGLPREVDAVRIPSPFDFPNVATFRVPVMQSDPRSASEHTEEIGRLLPDLLEEDSSALVLFTSWRQFRAVVDAMPRKILDRAHLQGRSSKQRLLDEHREAIDRGEPSYLFGLASFAEGVDLPGDYCRHVIIAKIPFSVPDDPLDEALAEWFEEQGRNPFFEITVPDASLRLVQACGRLIRNEKDSGRITLLDQRIRQLRYGQALLDALPPYRMVT